MSHLCLVYLISASLLFLFAILITGCTKKQENNIKSRIEHIDHILNNNPDDVKALTDLGNLYYDMRQYSKAILYYSRILVLTPENVNVRTDMGTCYKILGYLKKAEKEYIKSLQIDPNHLKTNFNLGIILYKMNRKKEAVIQWKKVVVLSPGSPPAKRAEALIHKTLKEQAKNAK